MVVQITLTSAGTDSGPFDIYSNSTGSFVLVTSGVAKQDLLAGYTITVPDGTTIIRLQSTGDCTNYQDISIVMTTTTTTEFVGACTCMDVNISQADLDDATGNTIPGVSNNAVYLSTIKNSACDGSDILRTYTSAMSENWCIKTSEIGTIQLFYYKNNAPVYFPSIDSTYDILYSNCSVHGDCIKTTSTTTAAPFEGCIQLTNDITTTSQNCLGDPYPLLLGDLTLELVDTLGNPVIATEDITITLAFEEKQCGDPAPIPITIPLVISNGVSSTTYSYAPEEVYDCGVGECQTLTHVFQSVVSISPSIYSLCTTPSPGGITVNNLNSPGDSVYLDGVEINGVDITVPSGTFPLSPNDSEIGTYVGAPSSSIVVYSSHATGAPVRLSLSTGFTNCNVSNGYIEFSGVDLSTNPSISITLDQEGSLCT